MKRKVVVPVVIGTMLASCAQLPSDISRSTAAVDHKEPGFPGGMRRDGRYDGPASDIDRRRMEREPSGFSYCEKYKSDTAKHVLTCAFGIEEAQRMAQGFAGGHGREDGYMRGYAWGLTKMERFAENNTDEMYAGEQQADSVFSGYSYRAQSDGANPGARDGESLGSSEAKGRFYAAVDTKKMPSTEYIVPPTSYQGVSGAYGKYVGAIPSVDDYLRDERRYGRLSVFEGQDRQYMNHRDHREMKTRDVWSREGEYRGESSRWLDGKFAFEVWSDMRSPGRQKYDSLNTVVYNEENTTGRFPAQAAPAGRPAPLPAPVVDYQAIFRDAFTQAYSHYASYFYTKNYYAMIDDGQRDGEQIGYSIGSDIARKIGLARGFDQRYLNASRNAYIQSFAQSYSKSFVDTYSYFKNNAILSLNFMGILGTEEDGIIQPGEDFKVQFKVTNVGGKPSDLKFSVLGDVTDPKDFIAAVDGISSKVITSEAIGEIDNRLDDGANAKIALKVNDMQEQMWQKVQRPIEFTEITPSNSILTGAGMYNVVLKNIATVALNGKITLELKISGTVVKTVVASAMNPGEKKSYALDFSGIDPLVWISNALPAEIVLKYNDAIFGSRTFSLSGQGEASLLASYYDLLINDKGVVPAGKNLDDRINEVNKILVAQNVNEVQREINASGNGYKENPASTVPGKIALVKSGRSVQSNRALSFYSRLADTMAPEGKKFKSFLFMHPKRDGYYEILKQIGGKTYK